MFQSLCQSLCKVELPVAPNDLAMIGIRFFKTLAFGRAPLLGALPGYAKLPQTMVAIVGWRPSVLSGGIRAAS